MMKNIKLFCLLCVALVFWAACAVRPEDRSDEIEIPPTQSDATVPASEAPPTEDLNDDAPTAAASETPTPEPPDAAEEATSEPTSPSPPPVDAGIAAAVADLAQRLGVPESAITVVSSEEVVWPDSSLGCPQPGFAYMQVLTDGRLIVLEADGVFYNYHSGGGQPPFLCKQTPVVPEITPKNGDEIVPPPGSGEND